MVFFKCKCLHRLEYALQKKITILMWTPRHVINSMKYLKDDSGRVSYFSTCGDCIIM